MPRYKIIVAYDGTNFHGWQKQTRTDVRPIGDDAGAPSQGMAMPGRHEPEPDCHASESLRTVQLVLERAVQAVVCEPVVVVGASRTDAGVHARGQAAAFTTQTHIPVERLPRAITSRLPDDVQVSQAEVVPDDFDPIRHAIAKGYRYRIAHSCARHRRPLFDRHFVTHTAYELDVIRMNEAARRLLGEHDFASFTRIHHGRESTVRSIYECKVVQMNARRCSIDIAGNGFLYNMIRIIAGTLVEVGRGVIEPETVGEILAARDRRAAGPTMPPNGLCLMWIRYLLPSAPPV